MKIFTHQQNLIGIFAQHRVAANLLMIMLILLGGFALSKLNTQFLPNFALDIVTVSVVWNGSTAEDVEISITRPIEQELRTLDNLSKMNSTSTQSVATITLEFEEHTDMGWALDEVKEKVSLLRNLPTTAEKPEISRVARYDRIARLLITGTDNISELRHLTRQIEHELLELGISKIDIDGLPEEEMAIQISQIKLEELGITLPQIADQIAKFSLDIPAGEIGKYDISRQLRSLEQSRSELEFMQLPIIVDKSGRYIELGQIATIERRPKQHETRITYQGKAAVELKLLRAEQDDALESARILHSWLETARPRLPPNIKLHAYAESWKLIDERISLLLRNGLGGLVLVVMTLFIFLNGRVAFWVAVGIPIALMGMLIILYAVGGSINMVSLFAMIMALGIVVDDAIVVGEDGFTHFQIGEQPLLAAEGGAQRMFSPVMAASLTTIAAFLPLMIIGGAMGNILFDIPLVMVCVLIASLIECFLILPGHLRHSFQHLHQQKVSPLRQKLEWGFGQFRDVYFRPLITKTIEFRWTMIAVMLATMIIAVGLLKSGRMNFTFFPSPDGTIIVANANFMAGTPSDRVDNFLAHLEQTLYATEQDLGEGLIEVVVSRHSGSVTTRGSGRKGDQFGSLLIELVSPDSRQVRNKQFIQAWQTRIKYPPGLENLTITESRGGPPGRDFELRLIGNNSDNVKIAALELAEILKTYQGVTGIEDDMPYGREQWIFSLTAQGIAFGLTTASVGQQLRAAFEGQVVQIFQDEYDEVEVRVMLSDDERYRLSSLQDFMLQLPNGSRIALATAVTIKTQRGLEAIRHSQGYLAARISADVDRSLNNSNRIFAELATEFLPSLYTRYGVKYSFEGRMEEQAETLSDMKRGMIIAFSMIYLILAWQFISYGWPLIVMMIIPFGLVGAIFGHWAMGLDLTILSLFGFFGLSGIVINDSIVMITFYRLLREEGMPITKALIEAACQRLRAVLLTSLTTIFGLTPLLFETSLQAQFLIPMATSIAFGLMFSTILVLLAIPAMLSIYEDINSYFGSPE
ncbi:MAG: efflux RND transporter permease subunit [Thiomargarita sp.]|nr:efflux RND transporter permease subunit [Thiomargarita sp.]